MTSIVNAQQTQGVRPNCAVQQGQQVQQPRYVVIRRNEDLDKDTLELSGKNNQTEEKGAIAKIGDAIGNAAVTFVNFTANTFARAASEVVVDKAIGKFTGK